MIEFLWAELVRLLSDLRGFFTGNFDPVRDTIDLLVVFLAVYWVLMLIRGTRAVQILVGAEFGGAGVVDQHVQAAELRQGRFHQGLALGVVGHVRLLNQGADAERLAILGHGAGALFVTAVIDHYVAALLREQTGGGGADAGRRTGDQSHGVF